MIFLNIWLALSLTNLQVPFKCIARMFCWPKASEVISADTGDNEKPAIPENLEQVRKIIEALEQEK